MKQFMTLALSALLAATPISLYGTAAASPTQAVPASACPLEERGRIVGDQRIVPDRYMRLINIYSSSEGVPRSLAFEVAWTESGFCQRARSHAGGIGLMQLTAETAQDLRVDPTDAHQNVAGGIRYLADLKERFGSWELALAAYNAGPGNVQKYGGIPPFPETQAYVTRIMARALPAKAAE